MKRTAICTLAAPRPIGAYSQGITAGGFLFCAGQIGLDPESGQLVDGGFAAEATRALDNLRAVLEAAELSFADVVKTTVYLVDLRDGAAFAEAYARYVVPPFPVRATVQVAALPAGARVEIEAIALRWGVNPP